jgi:malate dehydrogenase
MTRLDHNRAVGLLASRAGVAPSAVQGVAVWGNHADTMYPDVTRARIGGAPAYETFDADWLRGDFLQTVARRGGAIIKARGASSAASAASAAVDHMADWFHGTGDRVVSMAIASRGDYGVPEGLIYSFPVTVSGGQVHVVQGWGIDDFCRAKIAENVAALEEEASAVRDLLG